MSMNRGLGKGLSDLLGEKEQTGEVKREIEKKVYLFSFLLKALKT